MTIERIKIITDPLEELTSERDFPLCMVSGTKVLPLLTVELYTKWYTLYLIERVEFGAIQISKVWYDAFDTEALRPDGQSAFVDHVPNPIAIRNFADAKKYHVDELATDLLMGRWMNEVADQD